MHVGNTLPGLENRGLNCSRGAIIRFLVKISAPDYLYRADTPWILLGIALRSLTKADYQLSLASAKGPPLPWTRAYPSSSFLGSAPNNITQD